jgi:hypothetical protein
MRRIIAIVGALALVSASLLSLVFWARLPGRLPADADYQRAEALIRSQVREGDIIVLAPSWAERGRQFLTSAPVYAGYDFTEEPPHGTDRIWLVALADAPRFSLEDARRALQSQASPAAAGERIGQLWVEPYSLKRKPQLFSFTDSISKASATVEWTRDEPCRRLPSGALQCSRGDWNKLQPGWFEVNERPAYCLWAHPTDNGSIRLSYPAVPSGELRGWAAIVGQAAEGRGASVEIQVDVDGKYLRQFSFPNAIGKQPFAVALPDSEAHQVDFVINTSNAGRRHFCFDAWIEPPSDVAARN